MTPPLFDSDILIDAIRDDRRAVEFVGEYEQTDLLLISAITYMELVVGCRSRAEVRIVVRFLRRFRVIEIEGDISALARDLLRRFNVSHNLLIPDALIAATALTIGAPLATRNRRDFRFIPGLILLPYPREPVA